MRWKHLWFALVGVLIILGLRAVLPHRLSEGNALQVVGLLDRQLRARPSGVALGDLTPFAWDQACAVASDLTAAEVTARSGIVFPGDALPNGEGWLLVFARGKTAQAAARIPPSLGVLAQNEPLRCLSDGGAFLGVIEAADPPGPRRRFSLRPWTGDLK
jgi:hypothetical protein